jgi:beta-glucosidase
LISRRLRSNSEERFNPTSIMRIRLSGILSAAGACFLSLVTVTAAPAVQRTPEAIEAAVEELLGRMTLTEKLGQMSQLSRFPEPGHIEKMKGQIRLGRLGSVLNAVNREQVEEFQRVAMNESRLKIPLLFGLDVIHGYRTLFPIPLAQSCSWNPELVQQAARIAAVEAASEGVRWTFAPMVDLTRDPRWGRIAETLGEDPLLASRLGAAMVRGFQSDDLSAPTSLAACAKHFAGYGAAEAGRDYNTTLIPDSELRNCYLPAFKATADAGVLTMMSAFNDLNGVPTSANPRLLRKILRDEWGFRGFVVSDWTSVDELIPHGFAADSREAAQRGINAGVDMAMVSTAYLDHGDGLVADKQVDLATIDNAVRSILRVKFQLGLFDQPYTDPATPRTSKNPLADEHLRVARELAAQSMVLLKNEGSRLPLAASLKSLAVIGPLADSGDDMRGCWFCESNPADTITPLTALREALGVKGKIHYAPGLKTDIDETTGGFAEAVKAAQQSDVVVFCLGEGRNLSGEARSRAFLTLPGAQEKLFDAVAATGKPIVLVLFGGRPLVFPAQFARAQAVLYAWHPGTMAGPALSDLLFGKTAPSGKLTVSFPRTVGQIPVYYNHRNTGRPPQNEAVGIPMGTPQSPTDYNSKFIDVHSTPFLAFGHGLSYTTFAYSDLKVTAPAGQDGVLTVSATLTNTGSRDGVEVAQLYTRDPAASLTRPVRELKGFQRVALKPGEAQTVTFTLPARELGFFNEDGVFIVEPGQFHVWIGGSSEATLRGEFTL